MKNLIADSRRSTLSLASLLMLVWFNNGHAANFTVTFTNDSGPGSLRSAIISVNSQAGPHTIGFVKSGQFAGAAKISLATPLPTIIQSVSIFGRNGNPVTISGAGQTTLLSFGANTTNALYNMILANGYSTNYNGGAISNAGILTISACTITNNILGSGCGAAIFNSGSLNLANIILAGNQITNLLLDPTVYPQLGAGIYNVGNLTIANSTLSNNTNWFGWGGAVYSANSLSVSGSTIANNATMNGIGAGVWSSGNVSANSSTVSYNYSYGGDGQTQSGALGGGGGGFGGGIFATNCVLMITNCTIANNIVAGGNGGPFSVIQPESHPGGNGGGIYGGLGGWETTSNPYLGFNGGAGGFAGGGGGGNSSVVDEYELVTSGGSGGFGAGGGGCGSSYGNGSPTVSPGAGGTFGGNGLGGNSGGGAGLGGGMFIMGGTVVMQNCTVCYNTVTNGSALGSGAADGQGVGGGIFITNSAVKFYNTVVAKNTASTLSPDVYGAIISSGYNFFGNRQGIIGLNGNDFADLDPNLWPLQNKGGPTLTCAPLPGSYLIGYGITNGAPSTDQRGISRPQGNGMDIGAVEFVSAAPVNAGPIRCDTSGFSFNIIFDSTNAYKIRGSTNLVTWVDVTNYSTGGFQHFLDTSPTNMPYRFYRAVTN